MPKSSLFMLISPLFLVVHLPDGKSTMLYSFFHLFRHPQNRPSPLRTSKTRKLPMADVADPKTYLAIVQDLQPLLINRAKTISLCRTGVAIGSLNAATLELWPFAVF